MAPLRFLSLALWVSSAVASTACTGLGDNVIRCLRASTAVATPYCSSFLGLPVYTQTYSTFTPLTTTTVVVSSTTSTSVTSVQTSSTTSTETDYLSYTEVDTITLTTSATIVVGTVVTVTTYPTTVTVARRGLGLRHINDPPVPTLAPRAAAAATPKCLTQVSSSLYPASRISSACSCLMVSKTTLSVVATAPTSTVTSYVSQTQTSVISKASTVTVSSFTTIVLSTTVATTTVTASTETVVSTTTSTSTVVVPGPDGICGITGYGNSNYNAGVTDQNTVQQCEALCASTPNCLAYGFGQGTCGRYTRTIENGGARSVAGSLYTFWDLSCQANL